MYIIKSLRWNSIVFWNERIGDDLMKRNVEDLIKKLEYNKKRQNYNIIRVVIKNRSRKGIYSN